MQASTEMPVGRGTGRGLHLGWGTRASRGAGGWGSVQWAAAVPPVPGSVRGEKGEAREHGAWEKIIASGSNRVRWNNELEVNGRARVMEKA